MGTCVIKPGQPSHIASKISFILIILVPPNYIWTFNM